MQYPLPHSKPVESIVSFKLGKFYCLFDKNDARQKAPIFWNQVIAAIIEWMIDDKFTLCKPPKYFYEQVFGNEVQHFGT